MDNSLTQFQNRIINDLQNIDVSTDSFLAVTIDKERWLIDLAHIKEAGVPSYISKNNKAPDWVIGISNFKGDVWTIIDMRVLLKNQTTLSPKWNWVTLLRPKDNNFIALLWSEIVEIAPKEEYDLAPDSLDSLNLEPLAMQSDTNLKRFKWVLNNRVDKSGNLWKELNIDAIMGPHGLIYESIDK